MRLPARFSKSETLPDPETRHSPDNQLTIRGQPNGRIRTGLRHTARVEAQICAFGSNLGGRFSLSEARPGRWVACRLHDPGIAVPTPARVAIGDADA